MLNKNRTTSAKRIILAAVACLVLISQSNNTLASSDENNGLGKCAFSAQLENSIDRDEFKAQIKMARDMSTSMYGEFQNNSPRFMMSGDQQVEIDTFSFNCVSCHDGTNASNHSIRFKKSGSSDQSSPLDVHPIGMHYGTASYMNSQLKKPHQLHKDMLFADGRVGCLSCHNPLNPKKNHLVIENEYSNLCFSCHSK
jgi:predicted CXXCH cytochrome family protein